MKYLHATILAVLAAGLMVVTGCKKDQAAPQSALLGDLKVNVAGLQWNIPKRWSAQGERPMRVATYLIPAGEGSAESGECAVFHFPNGQGGDLNANIDRWVGQFETGAASSRGSKEVNGLKVATVEINGTYLAPGGMMMQSTGKKDNYRLLGAIVEGPQGLVFFKLTGPKETVVACAGEFDALVGSLSK